jgi:tetratricopeptide (TPR) repeat protein
VGHNSSLGPVVKALLLAAGCLAAGAQTPAADAAFRQGSELYRAGNCPEAVRLLSQSKGTPRAFLLMGRCYLEMAEFAAARTALQQYNQAVPGDEETAILLARAVEGAGNAAEAAAALEELRKQGPASLAVEDALAEAYAKAGKPAQAASLYRAVLAVEPDDVGALAGLANLSAAASQWPAAAEQFKKVLDLSPDNLAAAEGLGQAQLQLGQVAAAIPYLRHAVRLRPGDWGLSKALASCYFKTQKWPETIQTLAFDSLTHAEDEEATIWMAEAFARTGDTAGAEQYYRAVLQRAAGNFTARMTLANMLYEGQRWKDAKEQYVLLLKAQPDLFEISDRVGQIAEQENNLSEAIRYYAGACRSPQATTATRMRLARLYFRTDDVEHARPVLEAVLQTEPDNREVKMMLTQLAVKAGNMDDAVRYAAELLPGDAHNLVLLRLLGEDALKHNNDAVAADYLERALAVDAKDRDLRFELVGLYTNDEFLDRLPRAFDLMNEYVGLNPDDYEGYLLLANLFRRKSDAANAHDYFQRGFNKMPPNPPPRLSWAYNSLGLLLLSEGQYEEALANQLKAVDLNPADATAVYNLALTYLKLKRKDDVNAARDKLSRMASPELLASLDDQIQRSRINDPAKK